MKKPRRISQIDVLDVTPIKAQATASTRREKIYVRSVMGKVESLRRVSGLFFLLLYLVLPWINYAGQQGILLDFGAQRFHLFSLTLWPQDLTLLAWLFIVAAFALFFVTTLWGRVWCGFMCPQTVFTFLFVWVEEKVEGAVNKRIQLDQQSMSGRKFYKKVVKHTLWIGIAGITGLTFVGYFTPIRSLVVDLIVFDIGAWPLAFVLFFAVCTYANAGWMREIMCTHMCPYSRFQSAMFDNDTVTVTYDAARGEGRGPRSKKINKADYQRQGLGDCIDCNLCVQVCPTGIDIRNGLQYECINCGACVDACNNVMTNMGYEKDLITFTSENKLKGNNTPLLRPKTLGYLSVLLMMVMALCWELETRPPLGIDVIRDRTHLYRQTSMGNIENVYTLVITNKLQHAQQVAITVDGLHDALVHGDPLVSIEGGELVRHPITIELDSRSVLKDVTTFEILLTNSNGERVSSESSFIYLH